MVALGVHKGGHVRGCSMCGCLGGMHGCSGGGHGGCSGGACVVALGGVHGCSGGVHGCSGEGHVWLLWGGMCVVFPMRYGQ